MFLSRRPLTNYWLISEAIDILKTPIQSCRAPFPGSWSNKCWIINPSLPSVILLVSDIREQPRLSEPKGLHSTSWFRGLPCYITHLIYVSCVRVCMCFCAYAQIQSSVKICLCMSNWKMEWKVAHLRRWDSFFHNWCQFFYKQQMSTNQEGFLEGVLCFWLMK